LYLGWVDPELENRTAGGWRAASNQCFAQWFAQTLGAAAN
jgi:hypothetical protein